MEVNEFYINVPPYLSTAWGHVRALSMNSEEKLIVHMVDGTTVSLPELSTEEVERIFFFHSRHLQTRQPPVAEEKRHKEAQKQEFPLRFGMTNMEGFQSALQHTPEQASAPDLPDEVLQKISAIAKIVAPDEMAAMPKAEPHCNCPHCQIARAITGSPPEVVVSEIIENLEEEVDDEELRFEQWVIKQAGDKLFTVTNKLDGDEYYNVFLGKPLGCTCGREGCEHILAVLKS